MTHRSKVIPAIVEAIAESEGCRPNDLNFLLYDHINTGALSALVAAEQTDWQVTIQVPNHSVEIHGDGQIRVDGNIRRQEESTEHRKSISDSGRGQNSSNGVLYWSLISCYSVDTGHKLSSCGCNNFFKSDVELRSTATMGGVWAKERLGHASQS